MPARSRSHHLQGSSRSSSRSFLSLTDSGCWPLRALVRGIARPARDDRGPGHAEGAQILLVLAVVLVSVGGGGRGRRRRALVTRGARVLVVVVRGLVDKKGIRRRDERDELRLREEAKRAQALVLALLGAW